MSYERVQFEVHLVVKPRYLNEPAVGIFQDLSKYLLLYSHILKGYPLSFDIEGVAPTGKILPDGSIYANCLVTFSVFAVGPEAVVPAVDGYVCGIFPVSVDGNEAYTGDLLVKDVEGGRMTGRQSTVEEESDF